MFQPNEQLYTALGIEAAKLHAVEYADRFSVWTRNDVCYCCCWCFMFHSTLHLYELVWSRKDHNRSNTFILALFNNHRLTRFEAFFFFIVLIRILLWFVYFFGYSFMPLRYNEPYRRITAQSLTPIYCMYMVQKQIRLHVWLYLYKSRIVYLLDWVTSRRSLTARRHSDTSTRPHKFVRCTWIAAASK